MNQTKENFLADFKLAMEQPEKERAAKNLFEEYKSFIESLQIEELLALETEMGLLVPLSYKIVEIENPAGTLKPPSYKIVAVSSSAHIKLLV